jgi:predicted amidohydrolase YtcJ
VVGKLSFLFEPARFGKGMQNFLTMMHQSGVTTALDMGTGVFGNPLQEIAGIRAVAEAYPVPSRIILTPIILDFMARQVPPEAALAEVKAWQLNNSERVKVGNHFKLMLDGAIFSGLSQFGPPGYLDGHEGVWMAPREVTYDYAKTFWDAGFQLHAHANGDAAAGWFIDLLGTLLHESPRSDHRMTLEHFAYSTEDQTRQLKTLGALVSANPYYHYILSELYAESWLGTDRASQMVRLGSLERAGIPIGLHSDSPMAPLSPLTLIWAASARETIGGTPGIASEALSRAQALRGVTIDAAWILGMEDDLGSIRAGKIADFAVLNADPMTVPDEELRNIKVIGTVFSGQPYTISK